MVVIVETVVVAIIVVLIVVPKAPPTVFVTIGEMIVLDTLLLLLTDFSTLLWLNFRTGLVIHFLKTPRFLDEFSMLPVPSVNTGAESEN